MGLHIASVVTKNDLLKYFGGETYRAVERNDGVYARSDAYEIEIYPKSVQFAVEIEATDDPSDSDFSVTDEPLDFIVNFLKTGTAGDEALQKMAGAFGMMESLSPSSMPKFLRFWAARTEQGLARPRDLARAIRRAAIMVDMPLIRRVMSAAIRTAAEADVAEEEIANLEVQMKAKGWKVKSEKSDDGPSKLIVDVSGIYTAKIEVESIVWAYSFEVNGYPDTREEGVTDDPIVQFRGFYKSEDVQSARREMRSSPEKEKAREEETAKPGRKNPPSEPQSP